jgi:ELWxxDGT repeat protein
MKYLLPSLVITFFASLSMNGQMQATLISDIQQGSVGSNPSGFVKCGNYFYFKANDGIHGIELWRSDGVTSQMVIDANPGSGDSIPWYFSGPTIFAINNAIYFVATDGQHGIEPWRVDMNSGVASMISDINPGPGDSINGGSNPIFVPVLGATTKFFFVGDDGDGWELWKSDGTAGGTNLVKKINTQNHTSTYGSGIAYLTAINDKVYFASSDEIHGTELWVSDGTPSGTIMKEINTDIMAIGADYTLGWGSSPEHLYNGNGTLYFAASGHHQDSPDLKGVELYEYTPGSAAPTLVYDINPGTASSDPKNFCVAGPNLYYSAKTNQGIELWKTTLNGGPSEMVKNIAAGSSDSTPEKLMSFQNKLYFVCDDVVHGKELWKSDGTNIGTQMVADLFVGTESSYVSSLTNVNDISLYFCAYSWTHGNELRETNGLQNDLVTIDINPGSGNSDPYAIASIDGTIYSGAATQVFGNELMKLTANPLSTTVINAPGDIVAWPNPATEKLHLTLPQSLPHTCYTIFNSMGQEMNSGIITNTKMSIDVSPWPVGMYFMRTDSGETLKIIKK